MPLKESDLFEPVKEIFEEEGYEVFSEVEVPYAHGRVDLIAYSNPVAIAVELKTSLTIELIEQALLRKNSFGYVYIAIPERKKYIARFIDQALRLNGIGVIYITKGNSAVFHRKARYIRPVMRDKIDFSTLLKQEHKTWLKGGSSGGGYVTHYKLMMENVKTYLKVKKDWQSINDILDHCETRYSSPKPTLSKALREIERDWCEWKKENGRIYFRFKQAA